MELKDCMLEDEMEKYLIEKGFDVWDSNDDDKTVDSTLVIENAIDLGYIPYRLENELEGELNDTYLFAKK